MKIDVQGFPWRRIYSVGKPFWTSAHKWRALALLGGAIACVIAKIAITVYVNDTNGAVWSALKAGEAPNFWWYLALNVGLIFLTMPTEVIGNVCKTTLALTWRQFLSSEFFAAYFAGLAALRLDQINQTKQESDRIDNPEWRMTAEVDSFANTSIGLFFSFFDAFLTIGTMGSVLYHMAPMLAGANVLYALFGSTVVYFLGRSLVKLTGRQQQTEGDLRSGLTEARTLVAIMANYRAQSLVENLANLRQIAVIDTLMDMMRVNRNIQVFTAIYYPLAPLIPLAIMGAMVLQNPSLDFGVVAKAQGTFAAMFGGMSVLVGNFGGLTFYTAIVNRLGTLMEFLKTTGVEKLPEGKYIHVVEGNSEIVMKDVEITTPGGDVLITKLNLKVKLGESVLIRGPQASGKSAALNAVLGTWPFGKGTIERPNITDVMIITQQPFMQPMTLREAMSYPSSDKTETPDERLEEILKLVDLGDIVAKDKKNIGFDTVQNWREVLSLSQQQRLALARIILKKPKYCLIDEASNSLEADTEKLIFTLFKTLGTTYITAGNNPELVKYHNWVLDIGEGGITKLVPAKDYEAKSKLKLDRFVPAFLLPKPKD